MQAVKVNQRLRYSIIQVGEEYLLMATRRYKQLGRQLGGKQYFSSFGINLSSFMVHNPFKNTQMPVVFADDVNNGQGSGILPVCPAFSLKDYSLAKRQGMAVEEDLDRSCKVVTKEEYPCHK